MQKNYPLISIIIVTLNSAGDLEKTLGLIALQTYKNIELIVVDGNSNDNTLNIIKENILVAKWISEPDTGVYNAMNKGILLSSGEWISFINAGDSFYQNDTLEKIMQHDIFNADIIYGDVIVNYNHYRRKITAKKIGSIKYGMICCHQSMLIRNTIFKNHLYNEKYKFIADFDLTLKSYLNKSRFLYLPIIVSSYLSGGISSQHRIKRDIEVLKCLKSNLRYPLSNIFVSFLMNLCPSLIHTFIIKIGLKSALIRLKNLLDISYYEI